MHSRLSITILYYRIHSTNAVTRKFYINQQQPSIKRRKLHTSAQCACAAGGLPNYRRPPQTTADHRKPPQTSCLVTADHYRPVQVTADHQKTTCRPPQTTADHRKPPQTTADLVLVTADHYRPVQVTTDHQKTTRRPPQTTADHICGGLQVVFWWSAVTCTGL